MTEPSAPEVGIVPLGGCGEVGLNATLIFDGPDAILIDCGVLLSNPEAPGVDRVVPDFSAIHRAGRKLHGVIITHGHEDHLGAIAELLTEIEVPIYGPPLAILILRSRLENRGVRWEALHSVPLGERVQLGPFNIELVRVTHSIPDAAALCIESRAGRILHSGDFKLDPSPVDGQATDLARLAALGDLGVDVLLADSTNSQRPGRTRSEQEVGIELERIALESEGRLVIACFASHLHRLQGIGRAAKASGRRVTLFGRSLHRTWEIGTKSGHLDLEATLSDEEQLGRVDKHRSILVVTGTQGEPRAALARLAFSPIDGFQLGAGDRVVLSAMAIPGNERSVRRVLNAIAATGAEVIVDGMRPVHCSGHAHAGEQIDLLRLVRPQHFVPIHGERAMLEAHARTAHAAGVPRDRVVVLENGESAILSGGHLFRGPEEPSGRRAIDAGSGREIEWSGVEERRRLSFSGIVICSVLVDAAGRRPIGVPQITPLGLPSLSPAMRAELAEAARDAVEAAGPSQDAVRSAVRGRLRRALGVRPQVEVHVLQVDPEGKTG